MVNDFGGARTAPGPTRAGAVGRRRDHAAGGEAVAHVGDVSSLADATAMVQLAIDTFDGLDVLVNNAGILRDRMLFSMREEEWDAVIKVHLKGTWAPSRVAAEYWRNRAKAGDTNVARLINTTSVSGIYGNPGRQLRRRQGGHRRVHADRRRGARTLRRHGQRRAPGALDPVDRRPPPARRDAAPLRPRVGGAGDHLAGLSLNRPTSPAR